MTVPANPSSLLGDSAPERRLAELVGRPVFVLVGPASPTLPVPTIRSPGYSFYGESQPPLTARGTLAVRPFWHPALGDEQRVEIVVCEPDVSARLRRRAVAAAFLLDMPRHHGLAVTDRALRVIVLARRPPASPRRQQAVTPR